MHAIESTDAAPRRDAAMPDASLARWDAGVGGRDAAAASPDAAAGPPDAAAATPPDASAPVLATGFSSAALQWSIPAADDLEWKIDDSYSRHALVDLDGDERPDFVDSEHEGTTDVNEVWGLGGQQSWRVYRNDGAGFDAVPMSFNVPTAGEYDWKSYDSYSRHAVLDLNGDGLLDFVDSEDETTAGASDVRKAGAQEFWRVFLGR